MDIFLVLDYDTAKVYMSDPRFQHMDFFKVSDGPGALQGMRIHNAYVDRYCCKDWRYLDCIETIHSSISLTNKDGRIYLL